MKRIHTFVILAYFESDDLEECVKSIKKQSMKSDCIIVTNTPNEYIMEIASKYSLGVMVNNEKINGGNDYNFILNSFNTPLITISNQDDLFNRNYTKEIINIYQKNKDASIIFTDNYEIDKDKKINKNHKLNLKRRLCLPLKYSFFQDKTFFKLLPLKYINGIYSGSVTYVRENIPNNLFSLSFIYYYDWDGFINLAKNNLKFIYLDKKLVGYRLCNRKMTLEKEAEIKVIYKEFYKEKKIDKLIKKYMNYY